MIANIIQSQESERLRISLQMHDGPAQAMSNLVLRAEICQRLLDRDLDQARAELVALKTAVNNTLQETRKFIFDLRPMTLDDLGLVPTLRRYVAQVAEKHKIDINLMVQNLDQRLPGHYEVTIFRFIQEAINNVVRHSGATQARVMLENSDNVLQILIEDNGNGFAVKEAIASAGTARTWGWRTCASRSRYSCRANLVLRVLLVAAREWRRPYRCREVPHIAVSGHDVRTGIDVRVI